VSLSQRETRPPLWNRAVQNGSRSNDRRRIRALVRVDHPLLRAGLRATLEASGHVDVVDDAGAAEIVIVHAATSLRPPRRVSGSSPSPQQVVVVAGRMSESVVLDAVRAGVRAIVDELATETDLVTAVRAVAGGAAFLSPRLTVRLLDWLADRLPDRPHEATGRVARLSGREREVLELLGSGRSNAEIARALAISETTVRSHVYHIITKLGLRSRTEAALFGYRLRLGGQDRAA
jgi:DNA-binding NarL/FixJ family response regulator